MANSIITYVDVTNTKATYTDGDYLVIQDSTVTPSSTETAKYGAMKKATLSGLKNYVLQGSGMTVDTAMSDTSTNAVQNKVIKAYVDAADATKQATLVSGTNIKTVNGNSILGSGNIAINSGVWGNITGTLSNQTDLNTALNAKASTTDLTSHTANSTVHITSTERNTWNGKSVVSVSATGSAIDEVKYITINGVEKKLPSGGGSGGGLVDDVLLNGTSVVSSRTARINITASASGTSTTEVKYITIGSTEYKLPTGGSGGTIDTAMSDSSTNAVQNKVIKAYADTKSVVSVSATGSATSEVKYITINGAQYKLPTGGSGGGVSDVKVDGTSVVTSGVANISFANYYTKSETYDKSGINVLLSSKQNTLSTAQLNACNSGITAEKVTTYDAIPATVPWYTSATLTVAGWSGGTTQTISITGFDSSTMLGVPMPDGASTPTYKECRVYASGGSGSNITFTCETTPTEAIALSVMVIPKGV